MKQKAKIGIYPGTFDPITLGHLDIIQRSIRLCESLIIAVTQVTHKESTFPIEERVQLIKESLADFGLDLEVESFDGLLVSYARSKGARVVFRGLRAVSDFEYEFQMALMNKKLAPEVEQVFLAPDQEYIYLSSSLVKEVASLGGDVSELVTTSVGKALHQRFGLDK